MMSDIYIAEKKTYLTNINIIVWNLLTYLILTLYIRLKFFFSTRS